GGGIKERPLSRERPSSGRKRPGRAAIPQVRTRHIALQQYAPTAGVAQATFRTATWRNRQIVRASPVKVIPPRGGLNRQPIPCAARWLPATNLNDSESQDCRCAAIKDLCTWATHPS